MALEQDERPYWLDYLDTFSMTLWTGVDLPSALDRLGGRILQEFTATFDQAQRGPYGNWQWQSTTWATSTS